MRQQTGIVKNIHGQFKAVDKDGKVRILKKGDIIYEGDEVSSIHEKGGEFSDSVGNNINSEKFFVLIQDLRNSETYLIPQGGYRFFDIQDMGNDETAIGRQTVSSLQTIDSTDSSRGYLSDQPFVEPQEFLSSPRTINRNQNKFRNRSLSKFPIRNHSLIRNGNQNQILNRSQLPILSHNQNHNLNRNRSLNQNRIQNLSQSPNLNRIQNLNRNHNRSPNQFPTPHQSLLAATPQGM